jgi:hypothetical protein
MIMLTLYSRPDCHLCEAMNEELAPLLRGRGQLNVIDISGDVELERRYGLRIPVLTAGDQELSFYRLDRSRVEHYLSGTT